MDSKTTLVIGASTNPAKYAYLATDRLRKHGHPVIAFGLREGTIGDVRIETHWNPDWKVDTVTLYINGERVEEFRDRILALHPKRVIFNPGTENFGFIKELRENNINAEIACTLVLLGTGQY